jgi:hypothetical protein
MRQWDLRIANASSRLTAGAMIFSWIEDTAIQPYVSAFENVFWMAYYKKDLTIYLVV